MDDFTDAYDDHVWTVYGFLAQRTRSATEAEDLTQKTFERAYRSWRRYDPARGELRTWLLSIARNVYVEWRRGEQGVAVPLAPEDLPEETEVAPQRVGIDPELAAAMGRLGPSEREAIALRFGGDLPIAEVAEVMGVSLANAQQILSRALRKLRRELEARRDPLRIETD